MTAPSPARSPESRPTYCPQYYLLPPESESAMDVIEGLGFNFNLGCALKYLIRLGRKPGADPVEDLNKAVDCLNREIALRSKTRDRETVRERVTWSPDRLAAGKFVRDHPHRDLDGMKLHEIAHKLREWLRRKDAPKYCTFGGTWYHLNRLREEYHGKCPQPAFMSLSDE